MNKRELSRRIKRGVKRAQAEGRISGPKYEKKAEILELRKSGKTYMEIVEILGCAKSTVWRTIASA